MPASIFEKAKKKFIKSIASLLNGDQDKTNTSSTMVSSSFSLLISQLHKFYHFFIDVFFRQHPKVMIELGIARYLRYFLKTQVIGICLLEWKDYMNKIFSELRNINDTLTRSSQTNHGFGGLNSYASNSLKPSNEMIKQSYCKI